MEVNHLKNGGSFRMMINHWLKNGWFLNQLIKDCGQGLPGFFHKKHGSNISCFAETSEWGCSCVCQLGDSHDFLNQTKNLLPRKVWVHVPSPTQDIVYFRCWNIFVREKNTIRWLWRIHPSIHPTPPSASRTLLGTAVLPAASFGPIPCPRNLPRPRPCRRPPRDSIRWGVASGRR